MDGLLRAHDLSEVPDGGKVNLKQALTSTSMEVPPGFTPQPGLAYDSLASRYDRLLLENRVLAHSARVSLSLVRKVVEGSATVLEIGAGTGRETLDVAAHAKHVVACDPSSESLEVLRRKAAALGLADRIRTHVLAASGIGALADDYGEHSFDAAYASFSLSYEPDLSVVPPQVHRLLKPDAPFLCSIFNRICLSELAVFAPLLLPRRAFRRLEGWTELPVDRHKVVIRSYTRRQVVRAFTPLFRLVEVHAIPAVIPPHYLHLLVDLAGSLRPGWEALDLRLNHRWPFKFLGSHTAYLFRSCA